MALSSGRMEFLKVDWSEYARSSREEISPCMVSHMAGQPGLVKSVTTTLYHLVVLLRTVPRPIISMRVSHRSQRYPTDSRTVKIDSNRSGMAKFASCFLGPSLSPLEGRSSIPLSLSQKKKKESMRHVGDYLN